MNYLGHLLLTYPHEDHTFGNLLGDMLRAKEAEHLPGPIRKGMQVHYFIDSYTDHHAGIRELVLLLRPTQGKYAPVVLDILMDHLLCQQWDQLAPVSFKTFTEWVYSDVIPPRTHLVQERTATRLTSMAQNGWLDGFPHEDGMHYVFGRMQKRASFPSQFLTAMDDYQKHRAIMLEVFKTFYRDLQEEYRRIFPGA